MQCSLARVKPSPTSLLNSELRLQRDRLVLRPQAQVGVEGTGVDQLARVHPVLRVPRVLELAERLHQLGAEHDRQQLALRLAVAVLARERAAVLDHQVRRLGEEAPPVRQPGGRAQLEVDARMDAAVAEVAVERSAVAEALDQRLEFPAGSRPGASGPPPRPPSRPPDRRPCRRRLSAVAEAPVSRIVQSRDISDLSVMTISAKDASRAKPPPPAYPRRTRPSARPCPAAAGRCRRAAAAARAGRR